MTEDFGLSYAEIDGEDDDGGSILINFIGGVFSRSRENSGSDLLTNNSSAPITPTHHLSGVDDIENSGEVFPGVILDETITENPKKVSRDIMMKGHLYQAFNKIPNCHEYSLEDKGNNRYCLQQLHGNSHKADIVLVKKLDKRSIKDMLTFATYRLKHQITNQKMSNITDQVRCVVVDVTTDSTNAYTFYTEFSIFLKMLAFVVYGVQLGMLSAVIYYTGTAPLYWDVHSEIQIASVLTVLIMGILLTNGISSSLKKLFFGFDFDATHIYSLIIMASRVFFIIVLMPFDLCFAMCLFFKDRNANVFLAKLSHACEISVQILIMYANAKLILTQNNLVDVFINFLGLAFIMKIDDNIALLLSIDVEVAHLEYRNPDLCKRQKRLNSTLDRTCNVTLAMLYCAISLLFMLVQVKPNSAYER